MTKFLVSTLTVRLFCLSKMIQVHQALKLATFFPVLGKLLIAFSLRGLIYTNIIFLILGPISFLALSGYISIFQKGQSSTFHSIALGLAHN